MTPDPCHHPWPGTGDATVNPPPLSAAIDLAGRLAELGETRLVLIEPGQAPRRFGVRETDLPAVILAAMSRSGATLAAESLDIRITIDVAGPRPADARAAAMLADPSRTAREAGGGH
jgi:hypothetical protein